MLQNDEMQIPEEGDVFTVQPLEGEIFYGKVLKANIQYSNKYSELSKSSIIVIFNRRANSDNSNYKNLDPKEIIIPPSYVDNAFWNKGFFKIIGRENLTEKEKNLDYGFVESKGGFRYWLLDYKGEYLSHKPKLLSRNFNKKEQDLAKGMWTAF